MSLSLVITVLLGDLVCVRLWILVELFLFAGVIFTDKSSFKDSFNSFELESRVWVCEYHFEPGLVPEEIFVDGVNGVDNDLLDDLLSRFLLFEELDFLGRRVFLLHEISPNEAIKSINRNSVKSFKCFKYCLQNC